MKTEGIEALIYPSPDFFKPAPGGTPPNDAAPVVSMAAAQETAPKDAVLQETIKKRINAIVSEVNQRLLPYQRIEKITILDEPMEMTTTKKIRRDVL
jgi:long-chain acyl-CoA synthetase